ncbi:MAG: carbohydrate ABC transporter permease [Clostridia bacterium]|nr:carbohydrate ABC transporter permease [Clostridia bacterium]
MRTELTMKSPEMKLSKKVEISKLLSYLLLIAIAVIVFLPIIITLFASFKTAIQLGEEFPLKPPALTSLNFETYKTVFTEGKILLGLKNSLILVAVSIVINSLLGAMTAYVLNRFNFRFKKAVFGLFMLGMIIPTLITEIARFPIIHSMQVGDFKVYNTLLAPIIIYAAADLMQIYIYTQFVEKISISLDESAMMDGCSYYGIFWKIIFPLLLPATATLAIIKTVDILNDMYIPYLYMPAANLRTMTTTLMDFSNQRSGSWETLSAAIMIVMLPTLIIFLIFQKYIFSGITAGAVKE